MGSVFVPQAGLCPPTHIKQNTDDSRTVLYNEVQCFFLKLTTTVLVIGKKKILVNKKSNLIDETYIKTMGGSA